MAAPMPRLAPVTSAVRPARLPMSDGFDCAQDFQAPRDGGLGHLMANLYRIQVTQRREAVGMPEAWVIDGVRTPRGKGRPNGALHGIHPQELLAQVLNAL